MLNGDAHHSNKRTGELSIRIDDFPMTERHSIPDSSYFDNDLAISCFMQKTTSKATACYNKGLRCLTKGDFAEAIAQLRTAAQAYWGDEETLAALCLARR
jgi:hypothetical protein